MILNVSPFNSFKNYSQNRYSINFSSKNQMNNGKVQADCFERQNIGRICKKELITPSLAQDIVRKYNSTRYLGSIPQKWLSNFPKEEQEFKRNELLGAFSTFAKNTSCDIDCYDISEKDKSAMNFLEEKIRKTTSKDVKIEYLERGTIGRAFKISFDDEDYVVKTFFKNPFDYGYKSVHGKGAEVLAAAYADKHSSKGQFAQFYFGKFATEKDDDGFLVAQYMNYENSKKSPIGNYLIKLAQRHPVESYDNFNINNKVFDTTIDYGGLKKGNYKNPNQYRLHREILEAIDCADYEKYKQILEENKGKDLDVVLKTIQMTFDMLLLYNFLRGEALGVKPFEHDDERYKIATNPDYLKIYSMLKFALYESDDEAYNSIIEKYKDTKELELILKYYNKEMTNKQQYEFTSKMTSTQDSFLAETLSKFKIL